MFGNLFRNIPDVTKNLLILNILFFLATLVMQGQGINAINLLGMHYPASESFRPYQIITHFFMHASLGHIFFNMFGLVVFGSHLERIWGKKRFAFYYFATAIGAAFLYTATQGVEVYKITGELFPQIEYHISNGQVSYYGSAELFKVIQIYEMPSVGASGAIYGLLLGFAMLFPNTELRLLFPPIAIKAKWLALILAGISLVLGYQNNPGDSIAHFAHLGGMLFGFIIIKIWQRNRKNFW